MGRGQGHTEAHGGFSAVLGSGRRGTRLKPLPEDIVSGLNDRLETWELIERPLPEGEEEHLAVLQAQLRPEYRERLDLDNGRFDQESDFLMQLESKFSSVMELPEVFFYYDDDARYSEMSNNREPYQAGFYLIDRRQLGRLREALNEMPVISAEERERIHEEIMTDI